MEEKYSKAMEIGDSKRDVTKEKEYENEEKKGKEDENGEDGEEDEEKHILMDDLDL